MRIARQPVTITFPADFLLVACTNPCPCGLGPPAVRLQRRRSGRATAGGCRRRCSTASTCASPCDRPGPTTRRGESSARCAQRVAAAVDRQRARLAGRRGAATHTSPRARWSRLVPLADDALDAWRADAELRAAHRAWRAPASARRPHARRSRRRRRASSAAHVDAGVDAPRGRPVSRARRGRAGHVAAATLAGLPDITRRDSVRCVVTSAGRSAALAPSRRTAAVPRRLPRPDHRAALAAATASRPAVATGHRRDRPALLDRNPRAASPPQARRRRRLPDPRPGPRPPAGAARRGRAAPALRRGAASRSSARVPRPRRDWPTRASWAHILADAGVTVVSGLAIGIDGAAHEGALDGGGGAVGVVATGPRRRLPAPPRDLYPPRAPSTASS